MKTKKTKHQIMISDKNWAWCSSEYTKYENRTEGAGGIIDKCLTFCRKAKVKFDTD